MESHPTSANPFGWVGGCLCLDFTNTVSWSEGGTLNERLRTYTDLVEWSKQAEILDSERGERLLVLAADSPERASNALEHAQRLRHALHGIFAAATRDRTPSVSQVDEFNTDLARAMTKLRLDLAAGYSWTWTEAENDLEQMLWPVAWSAAKLLTSEELKLARQCANERCGWLFLDHSRNRSRRWCDMKVCGNNAKARRHYQKKKHQHQLQQPVLE